MLFRPLYQDSQAYPADVYIPQSCETYTLQNQPACKVTNFCFVQDALTHGREEVNVIDKYVILL